MTTNQKDEGSSPLMCTNHVAWSEIGKKNISTAVGEVDQIPAESHGIMGRDLMAKIRDLGSWYVGSIPAAPTCKFQKFFI